MLYHCKKPFLFNPWKHHSGCIKRLLPEILKLPESDFLILLKQAGSSMTDFYYGNLSVNKICSDIQQFLKKENAFSANDYKKWISSKGKYHTIRISDGSDWLMREGNIPERYIHIHPGKHSKHTERLKSRTIKIVLASRYYYGKNFPALSQINMIRQEKLKLSPVKNTSSNISHVWELLSY